MTILKKLRTNKGVTQQEVANLLGITRGAYANIESGRRDPDTVALIRLADYFEVTIDYLLKGEITMQTKQLYLTEEPWSESIREDYCKIKSDDERRAFMLSQGCDKEHSKDAMHLFPEFFPKSSTLLNDDPNISLLVSYYEQMNEEGQNIALNYIRILATSGEYIKNNSTGMGKKKA